METGFVFPALRAIAWASSDLERVAAAPRSLDPSARLRARTARCVKTRNRRSYAAAGGPKQLVSASRRLGCVTFPTQPTYPSGRTKTAAGADTAPITGSSHVPTDLASIH